MSEMEDYLRRVASWPPTGDPNTFKSVHWTFDPGNRSPEQVAKGEYPMTGIAVHTLAEAMEVIARQMRNPTARDIYVAMSEQRMAAAAVSSKGKSYNKPIRKQSNVASLKTLYIDIDVKAGAYATTEDAAEALTIFCQAIQMPAPTMVILSGSGGMHVYWSFDTPVSPNLWQTLADALADAGQKHGLVADWGCTRDSVRILRPPGTTNYKRGLPTSVYFETGEEYPIGRLQQVLTPFTQQVSGAMQLPAGAAGMVQLNQAAISGLEREARPVDLPSVAAECAFVKEGLDTGGANFNNPAWNLATLISVFADDGRANAHKMAQGHKDYTQQSTDELFDRKVTEREGGTGWPSCKAISSCFSGCAACTHLAAGKTPLHLGRTPRAATPNAADSDLPEGYTRQGGVVGMMVPTDGTGRILQFQAVLSYYPMTDAWIQDGAPAILHFTTKLDPKRPDVQVALPLTAISKAKLPEALAMHNVMVTDQEVTKLSRFLMAWIKTLQSASRTRSGEAYGWQMDGKDYKAFAYAGKTYYTDGTMDKAPIILDIAPIYSPKGTPDVWHDLAKEVLDPSRPDMAAMVASAFAGPLVKLTGHVGCLVPFWTPGSGAGKTTALMLAQAVWGHPRLGALALDDTTNSSGKIMSELRQLSVYWDEIRGLDENNKAVNLVFGLNRGREKKRLTASAQHAKSTGTFETLCMTTSNMSMWETVANQSIGTNAAVYRVFEIRFIQQDMKNHPNSAKVERLTGQLADNYGHVGELYARFLVDNVDRIQKDVANIRKKLAGYQLSDAERYWSVAVGTIILGAMYANEMEITKIDLKGLSDFLMKEYRHLQDKLSKSANNLESNDAVIGIMAEFLNAKRIRQTIVTDTYPKGRGRPGIRLLESTQRLDEVEVQICKDDGLVRIALPALTRWLRDRKHVQASAIMPRFEQVLALAQVPRQTLGAGTEFAGGRYIVCEFFYRGPGLLHGDAFNHLDAVPELTP